MRLLMISALGAVALAMTAPAQAQEFQLRVQTSQDAFTTPIHDRRGDRDYWGPHGQWRDWNPSWGDARSYARRWGFDDYQPGRGWRRDQHWYSHPSHWNGWGGWNWSFEVRGGDFDDRFDRRWRHGYRDYGYRAPVVQCYRERSQDWVRGRRALVSYVLCSDGRGRTYEQAGSRRIEAWLW